MPRAPIKRTYSKRSSNFCQKNAFQQLNALLAGNLQKREINTQRHTRRKSIQIKDLPPVDEHHHLIEDSFKAPNLFNDTFDKLKISDADLSPKRTETKPVSTQNESKTVSDEETLDKSIVDSLCIEKAVNNQEKEISLSSFSDNSAIPKIGESQLGDQSSNPVRKFPIIASTPAFFSKHDLLDYTPLINELSPISSKSLPKSIKQKTYDEIHEWSFRVPKEFQSAEGSPEFKDKWYSYKNNEGNFKKSRKKRLIDDKKLHAIGTFTKNNVIDFKLNMEPKVVINKTLDILGINCSVSLGRNYSALEDNVLNNSAKKENSVDNVGSIKSPNIMCIKRPRKNANKYDFKPIQLPSIKLNTEIEGDSSGSDDRVLERIVNNLISSTKNIIADDSLNLRGFDVLKYPIRTTEENQKARKVTLPKENKASSNSSYLNQCDLINKKDSLQHNNLRQSLKEPNFVTFVTNHNLLRNCSTPKNQKTKELVSQAGSNCSVSDLGISKTLDGSVIGDKTVPIDKFFEELIETNATEFNDSCENHLLRNVNENLLLRDDLHSSLLSAEKFRSQRKSTELNSTKMNLSCTNTSIANSFKSYVEPDSCSSRKNRSGSRDFSAENESSKHTSCDKNSRLTVTKSNVGSRNTSVAENTRSRCKSTYEEPDSTDMISNTPSFNDTQYEGECQTSTSKSLPIITSVFSLCDYDESESNYTEPDSTENLFSTPSSAPRRVGRKLKKKIKPRMAFSEPTIKQLNTSIEKVRSTNSSNRSDRSSIKIRQSLPETKNSVKHKHSIFVNKFLPAKNDSLNSDSYIDLSVNEYNIHDVSLQNIKKKFNSKFNKSNISNSSNSQRKQNSSSHIASLSQTDTSVSEKENSQFSTDIESSRSYSETHDFVGSSQSDCLNRESFFDDDVGDDDVVVITSDVEEPDIIEILSSDEEREAISNSEELFSDSMSTTDGSFTINKSLQNTSDRSHIRNISRPVLRHGKSWRRSLLQYRRNSILQSTQSGCTCSRRHCVACTNNKTPRKESLSRTSFVKTTLSTIRHSIQSPLLELSVSGNNTYGPNNTNDSTQLYQEKTVREQIHNESVTNSIYEESSADQARSIVLRKCGQDNPIPFEECYSNTTLTKCRKIGEGVYGEVFLYKNSEGNGTVMKIIPIEGDQLVNEEPQKKFSEILSEIIIAMELSNLRHNAKNHTSGFCELKSVKCVQGKYPAMLLDLWDLYDEINKSENDSPKIFKDDQLYIILELANGGQDMESFLFKNANESYSVFDQILYTLAVAEEALEFEHRDLHWGNVLISRVDKNDNIKYCLDGREFHVPSNGIKVSIIDFTLSRVKIDNSILYNDISKDPDLFSATGEYQFEVYRLMQQKNNNEWEHFEPYSNILWMHYIVLKMITALKYSNTTSKTHKNSMRKLVQLEKHILNYNSVHNLVCNENLVRNEYIM